MRTPTELPILLALVKADTTIGAILGAGAAMNLYKDGERDLEVPSMAYFLVYERPEAEVYMEYLLQFDPFVRSEDDLQDIQVALFDLFHQETEWISGGVRFRSQHIATRNLPTRAGVHTGPIEFSFKTVRQRYHS